MLLPETSVSLHELQMTVLSGILDAERAAAAALIVGSGVEPELRLAIYRSTSHENVEKSLRLTFPALVRLMGDEYFSQCVREYRRIRPSRSGDVGAVGAEFADYIETLHAADRFGYLVDVARLEWFYQEALTAADLPHLDLSKLAAVPPELYDALQFSLHPAVRLLQSAYPVLRIWQANAFETLHTEPIDLDDGGDHVLITRIGGHVECLPLTAGEFKFLERLDGASPLATAMAAATAHDAHFDAAVVLQRFVVASVIVDFHS